MYRVRFNLGRGENYKKWQIKNMSTGSKIHVNPETTSLFMFGCTLHNRPKRAQEIFDGANKSVCSWITCEDLDIEPQREGLDDSFPISYNPRKAPNWTDWNNKNIDGEGFMQLFTINNGVFL